MRAPYKLDDAGHSLDRFIERHYSVGQKPLRSVAEVILKYVVSIAVHVEDVPREGQEIWRGQHAYNSVVLVVRDGVVRTVLAPNSWVPGLRETRR